MEEKNFTIICDQYKFIVNKWLIVHNLRLIRELITESEYRMKSKARKEMIEEFLESAATSTKPEMTYLKVFDFYRLSYEFGFEKMKNWIDEYLEDEPEMMKLIKEIEKKKEEKEKRKERKKAIIFKEEDDDNEDEDNDEEEYDEEEYEESEYERILARSLDIIVTTYPTILKKKSTATLHHIVNHKERRLSKMKELFDLIKGRIEEGDKSSVILLSSVDCSEIEEENIYEILRVSEENKVFIPRLSERIYEEMREMKEEKENVESEMKAQKEKIENIEKKIEEMKRKEEENENNISKIQEKIKDFEFIKTDQAKSIENIRKESKDNQEKTLSMLTRFGDMCNLKSSLEAEGIVGFLRKKEEENKFDRQIICSQSSSDLFNLIDPNTKDIFSTTNDGNFWIEIEIENRIEISGIEIFTSTGYLPKSFNIKIDGEMKKLIQEATELNGENRKMKINFDEIIEGKRVRIEQTGPNWDEGNNYLWFKRIEILSPDEKYSEGVLKTLVEESGGDPHRSRVLISSSCFDFNSFHLIDSNSSTCTSYKPNSWFQIEMTKGSVIVNGFRLKRCDPGRMKSFVLKGSNDSSKPEEEWTTLIEIEEKDENEHELVDVYDTHPSGPFKFIRLIQTGPNWSNEHFLKFYHFELFGSYF